MEKKEMRQTLLPTAHFLKGFCLVLFLDCNALLLNTGSLTRELAQIVQLGAANLTMLVHFNAVDVGRIQGEDTLHTYGARHLTNSETLLVTVTYDLNDHTTVELDTLLRTLDNFVTNGDGIARGESLELLASLFSLGTIAGCKCFFSNFN